LTRNPAYSRNPFSLEPINLVAKFFGREKETRRALSSLHRRQCVSIVGPARIGKTSFLFHVAHPHVRAKQKLAEEPVFVYLDSRSLANLDEGGCYFHIREEAIRQIKKTLAVDKDVGARLEKTVREAGSQTAHFGLQTLFRSAQANGLKLVIILDHLDVLNQNLLLGDIFFSGLRSLHTNYDMAYFVACQSPIDKLERICPDGPTSPFFNIFQQISIGPFTDEESRVLVVTLPNLARAKFPEFVIERILELGHNEPYRLQRAGYVAFQVWQENGGHLDNEHWEEIRRRFEEVGI
jgi:hypothetical protein